MKGLTSKARDAAVNECRILASLEHPNIIQYKEAFIEKSTKNLCIVMEYADGGDLHKIVNDAKKGKSRIPEKDVWKYLIQMLAGIKFLHEMKICHRDLKCANVFLTKDGIVKIGDLGVSKVNHGSLMHTQTGTPYYACPEIWKDMPYDYKSDVWSFGVIVYEMCKLVPPFDAKDMAGLANKICLGKYSPIPSTYSKDLTNVIGYCLKVLPKKRVSSTALWEKSEIVEKLDEFDCSGSDAFDKKLLATIKVPIRLSEIDNKLPKAKYDTIEEETKGGAKKGKAKPRLNSARPTTDKLNSYNKKPASKGRNNSSKKSSDKSTAKKGAPASKFQNKYKIQNKLSPSRALKPAIGRPGAPMSACGRRSPLANRLSPSPRYMGGAPGYRRPAGMPSNAKKY